jgi:hypothetical protein
MAQHRTLMKESIKTILHETVVLDGVRYHVRDVNHVRNGVYTLSLKPKKGNCLWVTVLVDCSDQIIYIDI